MKSTKGRKVGKSILGDLTKKAQNVSNLIMTKENFFSRPTAGHLGAISTKKTGAFAG